MRPVLKSNARALLLSVTAATLLSTASYADCTYELFNIASVKGTTIGEFIDQMSDECAMSVVVSDSEAEEILKKQMNKTYLKNLTLNEVLDLIVKDNNLQYTLKNNVLKISYLTTKTYQIDYLTTERKGTGSTNIRLSSSTGTSQNQTQTGDTGTSSTSKTATNTNASESGTNITSVDEVRFWETLETEVKSILNRPEDDYRQNKVNTASSTAGTTEKKDDIHNIFINKNAGMVTVTATGKQLQRLDKYIDDLQKKMQTQVLIDVQIYSVEFQDGSSTGIDWQQIYALQNIDLGFDFVSKKNLIEFTNDGGVTGTTTFNTMGQQAVNNAHAFQLSAKGSLKEFIKFLKTQGDVYAISNPKIMTLNNQPALITSGTELFYKTQNSSTLAGGSTGTTTQNEVVSSVFSGVLLDITPEIANDGSITLRINPSVSDVASVIEPDNKNRTMPPDLSRRQIASVVTVKDGETVIMGGLINTRNDLKTNKIPLLGDIPGLGWMFKSEGMSKTTQEMVIIIQPRIIKKDGSNVSLSDLGYARMSADIEKDKIQRSEVSKRNADEVKEMKEEIK